MIVNTQRRVEFWRPSGANLAEWEWVDEGVSGMSRWLDCDERRSMKKATNANGWLRAPRLNWQTASWFIYEDK